MAMPRGSAALTVVGASSQQQQPGRPRSSSGRALTWDGRNPAVRLPPVLMEELELMSHGVAVVRRKSKVTYADIIAWLLDQCPEQVAHVKSMCPPEIRAKFLPRSDDLGSSPPPGMLSDQGLGVPQGLGTPSAGSQQHGAPTPEGQHLMNGQQNQMTHSVLHGVSQHSPGMLVHPSGPRGGSVHWLVPPNVMTRYPGTEGDMVEGHMVTTAGMLAAPPGLTPHSSATTLLLQQHQQLQQAQQLHTQQQQLTQVQIQVHQQAQPQSNTHNQQQVQQQHHQATRVQQVHQPQVHQTAPEPDPEANDVDITIDDGHDQPPPSISHSKGTRAGDGEHEEVDVTGERPAEAPNSNTTTTTTTTATTTNNTTNNAAANAASAANAAGVSVAGAKRPASAPTGEHALPPKKAKVVEMSANPDSSKTQPKIKTADSDPAAPGKAGNYTALLQVQQQQS